MPGRNLAELFHGKENAITAQKLREGRSCLVTGYGQSMTPILKSGDSVICEPVTEDTKLQKGDIVLCKVGGCYYLHKIVAIKNGNRYTIGNNHGHINGTIGRNNIFGLAVERVQKSWVPYHSVWDPFLIFPVIPFCKGIPQSEI